MKFLIEDNRKLKLFDKSISFEKYKLRTVNRHKNRKIRSVVVYRRIVDNVLKEIRSRWVSTTGGVYVKNLGYFAVYRTPHKDMTHGDHFSFIDRLITDGYMYIPTHFTTLRNSDYFYGFDFNETFPSRMTQEMYKNIKEGRRYTLNYSTLKEYLKKRTQL